MNEKESKLKTLGQALTYFTIGVIIGNVVGLIMRLLLQIMKNNF